MNWKEFLKPNLKKVIIFVIILVYSIRIDPIVSGGELRGSSIGYVGEYLQIITFLPIFIGFLLNLHILVFWPIIVAYWYILSSLISYFIIWTYSRLRQITSLPNFSIKHHSDFKLNWKEFLKHTKGKIITFVIVLILTVFYAHYSVDVTCPIYDEPFGSGEKRPSCEEREGILPIEVLYLLILPLFISGQLLSIFGGGFLLGTLFILSIPLTFIWLYAISSLITNLLKSKKK